MQTFLSSKFTYTSTNCILSSNLINIWEQNKYTPNCVYNLNNLNLIGTKEGDILITNNNSSEIYEVVKSHTLSVMGFECVLNSSDSNQSKYKLMSYSKMMQLEWSFTIQEITSDTVSLNDSNFINFLKYSQVSHPNIASNNTSLANVKIIPGPPDIIPNQETINYKFEFIYGYNNYGLSNVIYISKSIILYPVGRIIVILDYINWNQSFYTNHTNIVLTNIYDSIHGNVASCQIGSAKVHIWEAKQRKLINVLELV